MAPKGTSPEFARTLAAHMNEILKLPQVDAKMRTFGAIAAAGGGTPLARRKRRRPRTRCKIIKVLGISAD